MNTNFRLNDYKFSNIKNSEYEKKYELLNVKKKEDKKKEKLSLKSEFLIIINEFLALSEWF